MFGKLLKYDFKQFLKVWLLVGTASVVMSALGGASTRLSQMFYTRNNNSMGTLLAFVAVVSALFIAAFAIFTFVTICIRFNGNFFTNEGYLTFTLPVKRTSLLTSKLISGFVYYLSAIIICVVDVIIFALIAVEEFHLPDLFRMLRLAIDEGVAHIGAYLWVYTVLFIAIVLVGMLMQLTYVYFCITFANTKFKKNRLLGGIGVYYLGSLILGIISQTLAFATIYLFRLESLSYAYTYGNDVMLRIALGMLLAFVYFAVITAGLYFVQLYMIRKKLNLA